MQKKPHKSIPDFYHALVCLPDHCYPFKNEVSGQWVRGIRSYNAKLEKMQREYGAGHYGFKLDAYRQVFHLAGSILFLIVSAFLSQLLFGSDAAMYVFLAIAVAFISFQEFYLQRKTYQQLWRKGVADWLTWCAPMATYFFNHFL